LAGAIERLAVGAQPLRQTVDPAAVLVPLLDGALRLVQLAQQRAHAFGADLRAEDRIAFLARLDAQLVVLVLIQQLLVLDVLLPRMRDHVAGVVDHLLEIAQR
jgi:hypothetical protein